MTPKMTLGEMAALYNHANPSAIPVKRFADRAAAERRVAEALSAVGATIHADDAGWPIVRWANGTEERVGAQGVPMAGETAVAEGPAEKAANLRADRRAAKKEPAVTVSNPAAKAPVAAAPAAPTPASIHPAPEAVTLADITAQFNALVPEANRLGVAWARHHKSLFESKAKGQNQLARLQAAVYAGRVARG